MILDEIDLLYFDLKSQGFSYNDEEKGSPVIHLHEGNKFYSVTPGFSDEESSYSFQEGMLTKDGKEVPVDHRTIGRVLRTPSYTYVRGIREMMPTLDDESILALNLNQNCVGCGFCKRPKPLENITPDEALTRLEDRNHVIKDFDKITVVTGLFADEQQALQHLTDVYEQARVRGFDGRFLYIGNQIRSDESLEKLSEQFSDHPLKYAFTVEHFSQRNLLAPKKRMSMDDVTSTLKTIHSHGFETEYSYMPGIDGLAVFRDYVGELSFARPHLSIFRPSSQKQKSLLSGDFTQDPLAYLSTMRECFEAVYDRELYMNNLGNLWHFPADRLNTLLLKDSW